MLRYEVCSPIVSRRTSRIVQVVKMVRFTRVGAVKAKMLPVIAAAAAQHPQGAENWFAVLWRKLRAA